jgi:arylsulfatase A-like enzyme
MDLFPTFCDFAGAKIPAGVEGRSLAPIIRGQAAKVRDVLYTGYRDGQRAVRDDRWKLIRYPLVDRTQLFDLAADPRELNNLAGQPAHAAQVAAMTALLQQEMQRYADSAPLQVTDPKPADWTPPAAQPTEKKAKAKSAPKS